MFKPDSPTVQGQTYSIFQKGKKPTGQKTTTPQRMQTKEVPKVRQSNDQLKNSSLLTTSQEFNSSKNQIKGRNGAYFSMNFKKNALKQATTNVTSNKIQSNSTDQRKPLTTSQEKPSIRSHSNNIAQVQNKKGPGQMNLIAKPSLKKVEKENVNIQQPLSARGEPKSIRPTVRQQTPQTERKSPFQKEIIKKLSPKSITPVKNKSLSSQKKQPSVSSKSREREKEVLVRKIHTAIVVTATSSTTATTATFNTQHTHNSSNTFKTFKPQQKQSPVEQTKPKGLKALITQTNRGQVLPFSNNLKVAVQTNQHPKTPKSCNPITLSGNMDYNSCIQSIIQPAFKECHYYQTNLAHFHFQSVYKQPSPFTFQFKLSYQSDEQLNYFKDIYEEHFTQNFYSIRYCKQFKLKSLDEIRNKIVHLPDIHQKRTIVFDLDETLIHCKDEEDANADQVLTIDVSPVEQTKAFIYIRPYCKEMLSYLQKHFELLVFTASHQCYAEKVLDQIDPKRDLFTYRFYRDHCVQLEEGLFVKDLRVIGNRALENILLVDNAAYSFCFQPDNGVPIIPFYDNKSDKELIYLAYYLLDINKQPNWAFKNGSNFKLDHYLSATSIEQCLYQLLEQII